MWQSVGRNQVIQPWCTKLDNPAEWLFFGFKLCKNKNKNKVDSRAKLFGSHQTPLKKGAELNVSEVKLKLRHISPFFFLRKSSSNFFFFFFFILVGPPQPKKKNNNDALVWNEAPRRSRGVSFKVILVAQEAQGARRSREAERSAECRDIILPESF